ncbi:MAG: FG-GAP-like repeat-containing protein [Planctomycetaceae bacterium]|nr:FG-GAP-like repeat-containing protein [Planctomycetaceae bacterium]
MQKTENSRLRSLRIAALGALALAAPAVAQQFVDQTSTRFPVQAEYTNQCTIVDVDGDGDKDIVWANGGGYSSLGTLLKPRVFVNNGSGTFADETDARAAGITGCFRGVEAGDVDRDGDWDLVLAQDFNRRPLLLINNGSGTFADQTATRLPNITMGSARAQFGDIDNDGDLDILICNSGANRFSTTGRPRIFVNNGAGVFTDAPTTQFPSTALAEQMDCVFGDIDNDLDLDFHVGTRATGTGSSQLWINDGAGNFAKLGTFVTDFTCYSYDFGDIEGDGDLDLIGINAGSSNTELLLRNNGAGTSWTNISSQISPNPTVDDNDSRFIDYDMDGDLDLLVAALGGPDRMYRNTGTGTFAQVTSGVLPSITDSSLDVKVGDLTGDGKPDIITAQGESGAFQNRIYVNTGAADAIAPNIKLVEQVTPAGVGPFVVRTEVFDQTTSDRGYDDKGVFLLYKVDGGKPQQVAMAWSGNSLWRGVIPAQAACAQVEYWVRALDVSNNVANSPVKSFTVPGSCGVFGDLNGDGIVNAADLAVLLNSWGSGGPADLDGSGSVDAADMTLLLNAFS